jgi:hypothetical protein
MAFFIRAPVLDDVRHPGEEPKIDSGFVFIENAYEAAHDQLSII